MNDKFRRATSLALHYLNFQREVFILFAFINAFCTESNSLEGCLNRMGNTNKSHNNISATRKKIFFIGRNFGNEFGLGHAGPKQCHELTECPNKMMSKVFCGYVYNIFTDDNLDNIWVAGRNSEGACGLSKDVEQYASYTEIKYFKQNGIIIHKICTNPYSWTTFFISDKNKLYACGRFINRSIGSIDGGHQWTPILIPHLQNVIDAKSNYKYHIALCSTNDKQILSIIQNWCRTLSVPQDIINLLRTFTKSSTVYATTKRLGTGHPKDIELENKNVWNKVQFFDNKYIVKIAVGRSHTLFLEDNGIIWASGYNFTDFALGWAPKRRSFEHVDIPKAIPYFLNNNIKISDIDAGNYHNLAVDINGNVYSWGWNLYGQCGVDGESIKAAHGNLPQLITDLKDYKVNKIRCGHSHSYVRTDCGRHYLFGSNINEQCLKLLVDNDDKSILRPYRVDQIVNHKCKGTLIDVCVGFQSSKFVVICDNN